MIRVDAITPIRRNPIQELSSIGELPIPIQSSTSGISTIAPASSKSETTTFRPQLAPPITHYMVGILDLYKRMEKISRIESQICDRETQTALNHLLEVDKQKIELLQKRIKETEMRQSWSAFETVMQYFTSSSSVMIGLAIFSASPIAAGFLIAAGGLGLVNRFMSDLGLWHSIVSHFTASHDLQIKISAQIDTYAVYLATAISIAGSIGLYHAGTLQFIPLMTRSSVWQKTLEIIGFTTYAVQVVSRLQMALLDKSILDINAEMKINETKSMQAKQEIHVNTVNLRKIIDLSERIADCIKHVIASSTI